MRCARSRRLVYVRTNSCLYKKLNRKPGALLRANYYTSLPRQCSTCAAHSAPTHEVVPPPRRLIARSQTAMLHLVVSSAMASAAPMVSYTRMSTILYHHCQHCCYNSSQPFLTYRAALFLAVLLVQYSILSRRSPPGRRRTNAVDVDTPVGRSRFTDNLPDSPKSS